MERAFFRTITSGTPEWLIASGTPVRIHGYSIYGNDVGDGLSFYDGNEAVSDPVIKDVAQGSANSAGKTIMFDEPLSFGQGCYISPDATTSGSVYYSKI